jgi:hypothetical protein
MSKDYKSTNRPSPNNKGGAGTLMIGILIGLLLGLGLSLAVAWYINKMPTPFQARSSQSGKGDSQKSTGNETAKVDEKSAKAESKPRFDFYKILLRGARYRPTVKGCATTETDRSSKRSLLSAGRRVSKRA